MQRVLGRGLQRPGRVIPSPLFHNNSIVLHKNSNAYRNFSAYPCRT
ncbi:hypothetical protein KY49_7015 [Burkholderia sp. MSHR3999]|nr:hypothetical protein KY49_7015 [Burkholderia sp. MSHR3999]